MTSNNSPFGKEFNEHRKKLKESTIKENMILTSSHKDYSSWEIPNKDTRDGIFHAAKNINVNNWEEKGWDETDVYRKQINDSTYQQLNTYTRFENDSAKSFLTPIFFKTSKKGLKLNEEELKKLVRGEGKRKNYKTFSLNGTKADSILKSWEINKY